ncbi:hypothetical protein N7495_007574 [Penicillium taxi]|uniref:uncharacterized protein n=1 Tax=Penicillium taxi TaxID=168475 RepID=UPI0025452734|nr:uncharacterized protein N7495_007574 [Penicillium taxi]KAJ5887533.1 hypothetical protein N7495_007574 [Penicillium taxi]
MAKSSYRRDYLTPTPPRRSCSSKMSAHMKKYWLLHLVVFCLGFLTIALIMVYVAYPAIAQHDVNASTLAISRMIVADPTPNSVVLSLDQQVGSKSAFHPDMGEFKADIELMGAPSPFASIVVPHLHVRDEVAANIVEQFLDLYSTYEFAEYSKAIMLNEEVTLIIKGRPHLKLGALPSIKISYQKTVVMKGKLHVVDYHLDLGSKDGNNMFGHAYIPNPTVMTIAMGNITLNLFLEGTFIGNSYMNNIVLKPGNNTVPMVSSVNAMQILEFMASTNNTYHDGVVPFLVTGNSSVYHGVELPYFTEALRANNLTIHLNVTKSLDELGIHL